MIPDRDPRQQNFPWLLLFPAAILIVYLLACVVLAWLGLKKVPPPRYGQSVFL